MSSLTSRIGGWGRYPVQECEQFRPERYRDLMATYPQPLIARGQGRAYGDAALNDAGAVVRTERLQRLRDFDPERGVVTLEAGETLAHMLACFVPRGWFPLVTPGTKHVSVGGCIAADVHGKNHHHDGAFSRSVKSFSLLNDQSVMTCSEEENSEAYWATIGGMGLTGVIGEATLQLRPVETAYIRATNKAVANLEQAFQEFEQGANEQRYSVAWIDLQSSGNRCGRSVVMSGEHATVDDLVGKQKQSPLRTDFRGSRNVPLDMPQWLLNGATIGAFNELYYRVAGRAGNFIVDYDKFFYPLDSLGNWNRLYGKRGFLQYQCVIPTEAAYDGLLNVLAILRKSKHPAFLGVLKKMGEQGSGLLSFPMAGYTLAMDLPYTGQRTLNLMKKFDEVVVEAGGRDYLAKDARMTPELLAQMYPRLEAFKQMKAKLDPDNRYASSLSRRLGLTPSLAKEAEA